MFISHGEQKKMEPDPCQQQEKRQWKKDEMTEILFQLKGFFVCLTGGWLIDWFLLRR